VGQPGEQKVTDTWNVWEDG